MVDDLYFSGIKISSSFRPVMVNQPLSEVHRVVISSQLNKFSVKNPGRYIFLASIIFFSGAKYMLDRFLCDALLVHSFSDGFKSTLFSLVFSGNSVGVGKDFSVLLVDVIFNL